MSPNLVTVDVHTNVHADRISFRLYSIAQSVTEEILGADSDYPLKSRRLPSKPDDQRIVFQFFTEIGVDPANPTIRFAMSAAAAQKIIAKLQLATTEASKGR